MHLASGKHVRSESMTIIGSRNELNDCKAQQIGLDINNFKIAASAKKSAFSAKAYGSKEQIMTDHPGYVQKSVPYTPR